MEQRALGDPQMNLSVITASMLPHRLVSELLVTVTILCVVDDMSNIS